MDIEQEYMQIIESYSIDPTIYEKTASEIAGKIQHVSLLTDSIASIKRDNNKSLHKLANFQQTTAKQILSSVNEIKRRMESACNTILGIYKKMENDKVEIMRTEHLGKTQELQENLKEFEKKKMHGFYSEILKQVTVPPAVTPKEPAAVEPEPKPVPMSSIMHHGHTQPLTLEEHLVKSLKESDTSSLKSILENRAIFNTIFTKNNYNLTMLVLEHGSKETFMFYLNLVRGFKKQIKFTQKNTNGENCCVFAIRKQKLDEAKELIKEMKKQKIPESEWKAVKIALEKAQALEILEEK